MKYGVRIEDLAARLVAGGDDDLVQAAFLAVGAAVDHLHDARPLGIERREERCLRQALAGCEVPVAREDVRELAHRRTLQGQDEVVRGALPGRDVPRAQVHAADERLAAVDDQDLAVVPQVHLPAPLERVERKEREDLHAAVAERLDERARGADGADRVVQHPDVDARARPLDQRVAEPAARLVLVEDVGLERDRRSRAPAIAASIRP